MAQTSRGAAGFPSNAQGDKTSFAQSGGKATTFQGGTGGNAWQSRGGGDRGSARKAQSILGSGSTVNIRNGGGDGTLVPGAHGGAGKLNLPTTPQGTNAECTPHALAPRGFGGGY